MLDNVMSFVILTEKAPKRNEDYKVALGTVNLLQKQNMDKNRPTNGRHCLPLCTTTLYVFFQIFKRKMLLILF